MAEVAFTTRAALTAGAAENINDVTDCLDKLLAGVNNIESDNIVDGAVTSAKIVDGAVTSAKVSSNFKPSWGGVVLASNFALSGAYADVTGVTVTVSPAVPSKLVVWGTAHAALLSSGPQTTANGYVDVYIDVDGSPNGIAARHGWAQNTTSITLGHYGSIPLLGMTDLTAGSHTIKMRAKAALTNALGELVAKPDATNPGTGFYYAIFPA